MSAEAPCVGFVVIGRNEGERLERCLRSVLSHSSSVVYSDSASTDCSPALARSLGVTTVVLDEETAPLTAARGRNEGFAVLQERFPDCEFVQFIDGDCILEPAWIPEASSFLQNNGRAAAVCGRRFEANPQASIYNRLCDEEWDTPVGKAESTGGDALVRISAFIQAGGFRSELKAGEEPEMTARMRAAGWEVWRLDVRMTEHDARILSFGQWWRRSLRGGFGYAQVWNSTDNLPRRVFTSQLRSAFLWTAGVPALVGVTALLTGESAVLLALPLLYVVQIGRIAARRGPFLWRSWQSAALIMLAKVPESIGALRYFLGQGPDRIREYKAGPA